jgi:hypothetical protein
MSEIRQKLEAHGRPVVTLSEVADALGLDYHTLYARLRKLKAEEHPDNHGMFRVGGNLHAFVTDSGVRWSERHAAYWKVSRGDKDAI